MREQISEKQLKAVMTLRNAALVYIKLFILCVATFFCMEAAVQTAFAQAPAKVTGLVAEPLDATGVKLSWNPVPGANGYIVYIENAQGRSEVCRVTEPSCEVRSDGNGADLSIGVTYRFRVGAFVNGASTDAQSTVVEIGELSDSAESSPALLAPLEFAAKGQNKSSICLTWQEVEDADGYELYRSVKNNLSYQKIATFKKSSKIKYTNKKCKSSMVYYYKIRSYKTINGQMIYSEFTDEIVGVVLIKAPKLKSVKVTDGETALVKWKKSEGAAGYFIYRSLQKNSGYKKVLTVKGEKTLSAYVDGNESGKKYYFKVRAYGSKKLKQTYSPYSNVKNVTFNLLAYNGETYGQKAKRIFGSSSYQKYGSEAEAAANMTTITIAVWDFGADGVTKVTKYKSLTVHKNIAPTVAQIFKEIYEGEEKFPIKNVGGYSWRGTSSSSEHCEGLAIDINWEENYMIDNGVIQSGKLYQPGVNPYSIPTDGEVAKIMKKYGFSQGIWAFKNRYDYMHFSYFGT